MTHTTEQERAAYERELIDNHHYVPSDFSFKDGFYGGDDDYIQFGWDLWQAARRAPAVPETIEQRAKKLKGLQVLTGATAGVPEAIALARSRFVEAYGRSPLHDDLAYACLLIDAYGGAPAVPVPQCEPVGSVYTMEALVPGGREVQHVSLYMPLPAGTKLYAAPQPPEAEENPLQEQLDEALQSLEFYKRRCDLLQSIQPRMRDPERTMVCDVLANGHLLQSGDGQPDKARYAPPEADHIANAGKMVAAPVQLPDPDFKLDGGEEHCYYADTVRQLLSAHGIKVAP